MALDSEIKAKKEAFEAELKRKQIVTYTGYSVVGVVFVIIIMVLSGDTFSGILGIIGLQGVYNPQSGVYADCSKPENKNVAYCRPKLSQAERDWKDLARGGKKSTPFTLHND